MATSKGRDPASLQIQPNSDFAPLDEYFKRNSTRAEFEKLAGTYRHNGHRNSRMLSRMDEAMRKKGSLLQLIQLAKDGELPPTHQIVETIHKLDFDTMRKYATTSQGVSVIDNLEKTTNSGTHAFEEINGEDNAQVIIADLDNVRKKTVDDRKEFVRKAKESAEESKDSANTAGKDFITIARGIGTSSTFRKAASDILNLLNDAVQHKDAEGEGSEPMIDRTRNLVVEVRKNAGVRKALESLHGLYLMAYMGGAKAAKDTGDQLKDHPASEDLNDAQKHAMNLFANLGNGYNMTALSSALSDVGRIARDNKGFGELMDSTREFGNWAMDVDEEELTSEGFKTRSQELIDQSHSVLTEEERDKLEALTTESNNYMAAVRKNPALLDYKESMAGLVRSITGSNLSGRERSEHLRALRQDFMANLPAMIQGIRYVPLPRIAGQTKDVEFAADNIVLDMKHFVPEHMSFNAHSELYPRAHMFNEKSSRRSDKGFSGEQFFTLKMTGISFVAKRVAFYVKKKRGLPRVAEKGIADLFVDGRGMDVLVRLRRLHGSEKSRVPMEGAAAKDAEGSAATRPARELDIVDARVNVHSLEMRIRENKHTISSKLALVLMTPIARKLIERQIARMLTENLIVGDKLLAKYSGTAQSFIASSGRRAMASAKDAAAKGSKKSKDSMAKIRDKTKKSAGMAKKSADKLKNRRDSAVEQPESATEQTYAAVAQETG
ncbi:hypothetical protein GGF46_000763 [Coemansia sp. RSA 552]|nr:hypothetical protein GGF46_000763 [Coemansia sp. RSA 552]